MKISFISFLLCLALLSCKIRQLSGEYSRDFTKSDGMIPFYSVEKLFLKVDSTYVIRSVRYYDKQKEKAIDSSLIQGKYGAGNSNIFLKPEGFRNDQFCLHYKRHKLFFYDCNLGTKVRFSPPFKRANK